jgi:hypothetical protein
MAGGGVGEAALLETVMAAETAGAVAGGAELAGGLGSLVGAGELAGLGGPDLIANAGAGLAAEGAGGLPSILQNTAALNPEVASATQAAMQPGALQATNFAQPGAVQPTNIAQMMNAPGVDFAGGTAQEAVNAAANAVAPPVDPNAAMSQALLENPGLTQAPVNPYPTPGSVNFNDAMSKAMQSGDLTMSGRGGEKGFIDQAMGLYDQIPKPVKYGLGAISAIKALNALDGNKYGTPATEKYEGPLSRFKYNPDRYTPLVATPNVYRPSYAGGGLADLGDYADYAGGGRMLKGPGDGMSDSIPAVIAGKQPARLANDEFVVSADVVSHLGNGSSDAGAKQLYKMMDRVRSARTGKQAQAKQINPNKYMPA